MFIKQSIKYTYLLKPHGTSGLWNIKSYKMLGDKVIKTKTVYKNKTKADAEDLLYKLQRGIK